MAKHSVMAITCDGEGSDEEGCKAIWMGPSQQVQCLDSVSLTQPVEWPEGWFEHMDGSFYCEACWEALDAEEEEEDEQPKPFAASMDFAQGNHKFYGGNNP